VIRLDLNLGFLRRAGIFLLAPCLALLAAGCGSSAKTATAPLPGPGDSVITTANNPAGQSQTLSLSGPIPTSTNPFFLSLGTNGRTCNSCHRQDQGWSISAADVQARFDVDGGLDPIFNPVDGANCPTNDVSTPAARTAATTLLRTKGLIRIARPIPANAEFSLTAVSDPYNCSVDGLSLYRRPLPSTNLKFISEIMWDGRETTGTLTFIDLETQALNATLRHAQAANPPTSSQLNQIVQFETSLFTAQSFDNAAGPLNALQAQGGPQPLMNQNFYFGINDSMGFDPTGAAFNPEAFTIYKPWTDLSATPHDQFTDARQAIARGEALFNTRTMLISGVAGFNDDFNQPVIMGTCSTCHDAPNVGSISAQRLMSIGVGNAQFRTPDMPLYTLTCNDGSVFQLTDPGLAMTTGKCKDIGKFKTPVLRGLAARAPYFHDGSAATLSDVLSFYRVRFKLALTAQEKSDLIAFMNSL
jgi:cytochrome c peroxidase